MEIVLNPPQKVMATLINNAPQMMTQGELADAAGLDRREAGRWLDQLVSDGVVITDVVGRRVGRDGVIRRRIYQPAESCTALMQLLGLV